MVAAHSTLPDLIAAPSIAFSPLREDNGVILSTLHLHRVLIHHALYQHRRVLKGGGNISKPKLSTLI
jgi:hypothetical protein